MPALRTASIRCQLSSNQLIALVALYFTLVFNFPFLKDVANTVLALEDFSLLFLATVPLLVFCLCSIVFSLFSAKPLLKAALIIFTLISSLVFYGRVSYGVVFDYSMIQNAAETNTAEAMSYLNWHFALFLLLTGIMPALFIAGVRLKHYSPLKNLLLRTKLVCVCLISILFIAYLYYPNYAAVGRNNKQLQKSSVPFQYLVDSYKYARDTYFTEPGVFKILDPHPSLASPEDGQGPGRKQVFVMVLGETARAKNFAYNGYHKPTNSFTKDYGLVSFEKMYSCGTATAISVPCMFSQLGRSDFDGMDAQNQQNLVDLVSLAGVDVLWVDNNGCKGVCKRVPTINIDVKSDNPLCDGEYCLDEVLLAPLKEKLADLSAPSTLIVLHMMGSHGPTYFRRYPDESRLFEDDCPRSDIQNCSPQSLVNTYDNTIAYTDLVLSKVLASLSALPEEVSPAMLYVSDHGESLGESGAYLHGFPYAMAPDEQKHIPLLAWFPDRAGQAIDKSCLQNLAARGEFSHDNIFHSMLGVLKVHSTAYEQKLDMFAACMANAGQT